MTEQQIARFWDRVSPEPNTGCWLWTGGADRQGYGRLSLGRARPALLAHRVAWEIVHGAPPALCVLHHCDNPACVNPAHLFEGTLLDNIADMVAKGRSVQRQGEDVPNARLTERDVQGIRSRRDAGIPARELATEYSVSKRHVLMICRREAWGHVK